MKKRGKFHIIATKRFTEEEQGLIFYFCRCYNKLPEDKQRILDELYLRVGKEHYAALRAVMESDDAFVKICRDYYIASQTTLCRLRAKFFNEFPFEEMVK